MAPPPAPPPHADSAAPAQAEAPARRGAVDTVLFGPHGLRAGWRVGMFALLFITLFTVMHPFAAVLFAPDPTDVLAGMIISSVVMLAASVVAGWVMLAFVDRRPASALGFAADHVAGRDFAVGFGAGAAMLALAVLFLAMASMARWVADTGSAWEYVAALARSLAFFAVAAAAEEALFRGYGFQALVQGTGAWPAILASSALFAWAHGNNPEVTPVALANIFLAGTMLAVAYLRTRSLWFATAVHLGWNWTMQSLLGFPVSGLTGFDTPLYDVRELGPDILTGGAFGPEAGLAATVTILAGTVWLWRTGRVGESPRMAALRPLVDDRLGPGRMA